MRHRSLLLLALLLAACSQQPIAATPVPSSAMPATDVASTATPAPTAAETAVQTPTLTATVTALPATPSPTAAATATPDSASAVSLQETVIASLPPTATSGPDDSGFYTGVVSATVVPLSGAGAGLYAVGSVGTRSFDPQQNHFVAIYAPDGGGWAEKARVELENPDFVNDGSLQQVEIAPGRVWLALESGVGAHGGCYDLLSYDGGVLSDTLAVCHESPFVAYLEDIDKDGTNEVIVNQTSDYVFCYACGVKLVHFEPLAWDGQTFVARGLTRLPDSAPEDVRRPVNLAIEQANAGLWKDAQASISQTLALGTLDPQAAWDVGWIDLNARARADQAASGAYPLLDSLFYGDYQAALDVLRPLSPEERFDPNGPLVAGTQAEGWLDSLTFSITSTTELALAYQPDHAPALFLRGLARELGAPGSPEALADIERAAQLDPNEQLYAESLAYLRSAHP
jgi:hypothetical protein